MVGEGKQGRRRQGRKEEGRKGGGKARFPLKIANF